MLISRRRLLFMKKTIQKQKEVINGLFAVNDRLISGIQLRDRKIKELQKRLNFFGVTIGNEDPETVDFPNTIMK